MIRSYDIGSRLRLGNHSTNTDTGPFTTVGGVATDPTAIVLTVQKPDTTEAAYTYGGSPALAKEATGRFYVDVTLDQAGLWTYRMAGTGAVVATMEHQLHVRASSI